MKAVRNGLGMYISSDQIKYYMEHGYTITDDKGIPLKDPMQYAEDKPVTNTIPWSALLGKENQNE